MVQGNFIGTDTSGIRPLGNGEDGVVLIGARNVLVGGPDPGARNVISANGTAGVPIGPFNQPSRGGIKLTFYPGVGFFGRPTPSESNVIQNNAIGTDLSGRLDLGNFYNGIDRSQALGTNTIAGNAIKFNGALSMYPPPTAEESAANDLSVNKDQVVNLDVSFRISSPTATVGRPVTATVVNNPSPAAAQNVVRYISISGVAILSAQPSAPDSSARALPGGVVLLGTIPGGGTDTVNVVGIATTRSFGSAGAAISRTTFQLDLSHVWMAVPFNVVGPPYRRARTDP